MQGYNVRRVMYACVPLILLSMTIFCLVRITGDPAILMAEPGAKEEDLQAIRREFGLDNPLVLQYLMFLKSMVQGDFGKSIYDRTPAFNLYLQRLVLLKHAFKNAVTPVLTLAGINLVLMVNVAVVVESVFAWPGIGALRYEGVFFHDFPVVKTTVLMGGLMIVAVNLIVDILYAYIDPRIHYGN